MERKPLSLDIKELSEKGEFEGMLSPYHEVDAQGDEVMPGAFSKSIAERGREIPLLFGHDPDQIIGRLELTDTPRGLAVRGKLTLAVAKAREAYELLKDRAIRGLSIGFRTIKSEMRGDVRRLLELALYEGSLVAVPAAAGAVVTSVKQQGDDARLVAGIQQLTQTIREANLQWDLQHAERKAEGGSAAAARQLLASLAALRQAL